MFFLAWHIGARPLAEKSRAVPLRCHSFTCRTDEVEGVARFAVAADLEV